MKTHTTVGADIVAQVKFPYPIEPIVRHHHEHWNGHGYPKGLCGDEIPLACRILAVVDCYDALLSDRPYRRRLNDKEAMEIIQGRRGTMYDPAIVDEFTKIRNELNLGDTASEHTRISPSLTAPITPAPTEQPAALPLALPATADTTVFPEWLRAVAPDAVAVLYTVDAQRNTLRPAKVSHHGVDWLSNLEIPLGSRISGWVGANRKPIVNADPRLDLGDITGAPSFKSCVSVPVVEGTTLCGVLSLYCEPPEAFSEEQSRVIESMAHLLASHTSNQAQVRRLTLQEHGPPKDEPDRKALQALTE